LERIRILLVKVPGILGEIITEVVTDEPDMEVVGAVAGYSDLLPATRATSADTVIIGLDDGELPDVCEELLDERPRIALLGVHSDGRNAFVYALRPRRVPIGDVSPADLVDVIRSASRPGGRRR
jgi:DNA-binding NarL/FixJ family response regulator